MIRTILTWLAMLIAIPSVSAQTFQIRQLGLTDSAHQDSSGYFYSQAQEWNTGWITGSSDRFNGIGDYLGNSVWLHQISSNVTTNISLTDVVHTADDGYREQFVGYLNSSGHVAVFANRYNGTSNFLGQSVWNYSPSNQTHTRIGLFSSGNTRNDGYQYSEVGGSSVYNGQNELFGRSDRYSGSNWTGQDAWIFNRTTQTTTQMGLIDSAHTAGNGFRDSSITGIHSTGVSGFSTRFDGQLSQQGLTAWLFNAGSYTTIGLTDVEHTNSNGYSANRPEFNSSNDNGNIFGRASRYNGGSTDLGFSSWVYLPSTNSTRKIGLFTSEYTRSDGYQRNQTERFINNDTIAGDARRFSGVNDIGQAIWLHTISANTNTRIGFTDTQHTGSNGYQYSRFISNSSPTQAMGTSSRFAANGNDLGQSAWVYSLTPQTTQQIGLIGAEHTSSAGYQYSNPNLINSNGLITGDSTRYAGLNARGSSAWFYRSSTNITTDVSLTGTEYTALDGTRSAFISFLTESGFLAGEATRYLGTANFMGNSSFVYDTATSSQYVLQFSVRPSDNFSSTTISLLTEAGTAYGNYELFDNLSNSLGQRAYSWTIAQGFRDLGNAIAGGLAESGWASLNSVNDIPGQNILGSGTLETGNDGVPFLLTPVAVPEAREYMLAGLALLLVAYWSYRRFSFHHQCSQEIDANVFDAPAA